jgi:hypothetical protein
MFEAAYAFGEALNNITLIVRWGKDGTEEKTSPEARRTRPFSVIRRRHQPFR